MIVHKPHKSGKLGSQKPNIASQSRGFVASFHLLSIVWVFLFGFFFSFFNAGSQINYYFLHNFLIIISQYALDDRCAESLPTMHGINSIVFILALLYICIRENFVTHLLLHILYTFSLKSCFKTRFQLKL